MLIIIQKNIHLLNDGKQEFLAALSDVITSNRKGQHLVLCDPKTIYELEKLAFGDVEKYQLEVISTLSKELFPKISSHIDMCISISSYKVGRCDLVKYIPEAKLIDFALEDFITYKLDQNVALLAENLTDCDLFNLFCKSYMHKTGLGEFAKISNNPIGGCGSGTNNTFFRYKGNKHPVICIKDRDIKEPPNGNIGNRTVGITVTNNKDSYLFQRHKLAVHEAENLVPLYILRLVLSQQQNQTFLSFLEKCHALNRDDILLYLDFKKGISNKNMRKLSEPYRNLIKAMLVDNNFAMAEQFSCLGGACKENACSENGKCSIIKGSDKSHLLEDCKDIMEQEEDIVNIYKGLRDAVRSTLTPLLEKIISLSLAARPKSTDS